MAHRGNHRKKHRETHRETSGSSISPSNWRETRTPEGKISRQPYRQYHADPWGRGGYRMPLDEVDTPRWTDRGPHVGKGPRNYQRSDERIAEEVNERLTRHPDLDATHIEVEVAGAEITLNGTVADRHAKKLAEAIAEAVWGAADIHNRLKLEKPLSDNGPLPVHDGGSQDRRLRVESLNRLFHNEISASLSYRHIEKKFASAPEIEFFRELERDHRHSADTLRTHIVRHGGTPVRGHPLAWSEVVTGAESLEGDRGALLALKEAEEYLLSEYEDLLRDEAELDRETQRWLREQGLSQAHFRVATIARIIQNRRSG